MFGNTAFCAASFAARVMDFEEKIKVLRNFPVFKVIPINEVRAVAFAAKEAKIPAKTIIISQGDPADAIYLVAKGSARVYKITEDGEEITLSIAGPGDVIGEMALVDRAPRSAYVQTLTETLIFTLKGTDFVKIMHEYPEIAIILLSSLSNKIRRADARAEDIQTKKLLERTWSTLQLLSKYFEGGQITVSHEELAQIVGATRSKITVALSELEKEGKISLSHRKIKLL